MPTASRLDHVESDMSAAITAFPQDNPVEGPRMVSFVERKTLDMSRLARFLEGADTFNRWANRGPAWHALSQAYQTHFRKLQGKRVVPCANGGIALEALAALHEVRAGRRLRWVVSAFSFANTGRGTLADAIKVDCDPDGVLSLSALEGLDPNSFDGLIVTNPFGLMTDFSAFAAWQHKTGKPMLIDNAAGISPDVPDLPDQAFSLHHTKPYGFGEGGLAVVSEDDFEPFLRLLEYTPLPDGEAPYWVNNGKLSELSAASHLMRLETQPEWAPLYAEQASRIDSIAESTVLKTLIKSNTPAMSRPYLAPFPIPVSVLPNKFVVLGKYYKPLEDSPNARSIYDHVINIPTNPGLSKLSREQIADVLSGVLARARPT
ncbi:DegT/DnrJ/EryC1/StrS aminotransferase family protein [Roseovarius litorisediminis]|uniref:DegT/DnrJ/EryC1/StrS aminotransferase family protein n=1 Tax=Roseovarius litorisediminis TaxID=1312363 RepID=A0A1Y5T0I9_9RHOB|nr:DegT/DnrJ/EryC1/StrS aminotransferase family protein [Roseovarius litorisediminis]